MNNDSVLVLKELDEMIVKMEKACQIYRFNVKLAKELKVELPLELKNKMAGLAAMVNICEKVHYYKSNIDDILFGDWIKHHATTLEEITFTAKLINQYLDLKREVGSVEYFIPDELCGKWG